MSTRSANAWSLQPDAFRRLLRMLDPDPERAGEQYERLRQKLVNLFRWRGCTDPERLADETIDRVARRMAEGETIRVANPYLYFHGVALNVVREHWRDPSRAHEPLIADSPPTAATDPEAERSQALDATQREARLDCLDACVQTLSPESRHLLVTYHEGERRGRIEGRQALADSLGIPMNALRIRVFRVRAAVAGCMERCLERKSIARGRTSS